MNYWTAPEVGPRVFGLRIRGPLTLGHVLLLDELGSPLLSGAEMTPGDVALACYVCAYPHAKARRKLKSLFAAAAMRVWGRIVGGRVNFDDEARRFIEWFVSEAKAPPVWIRGTSGRDAAAPWWINRLSVAMGNLGMSYAEAQDFPIKRLNQLAMAFAESRGEVEMVNAQDLAFREMVARAEAALAEAERANQVRRN